MKHIRLVIGPLGLPHEKHQFKAPLAVMITVITAAAAAAPAEVKETQSRFIVMV